MSSAARRVNRELVRTKMTVRWPCGKPEDSRWIDRLSASAVRDAVRAVFPDLAGAPVELHVELEQIDPIWHRGTAWLG